MKLMEVTKVDKKRLDALAGKLSSAVFGSKQATQFFWEAWQNRPEGLAARAFFDAQRAAYDYEDLMLSYVPADKQEDFKAARGEVDDLRVTLGTMDALFAVAASKVMQDPTIQERIEAIDA